MNTRRKTSIVWWLGVLSVFMGVHQAAAQDDFHFVHYSNEDGLPSSYIKDIEQDPYGFIWLANRENVCRFDGYNFRTFPAYNELYEPVNLRTSKLELMADTLLVCRGMDGSYYYFDQVREAFLPYRPLNELGLIQDVAKAGSTGFWYIKDGQVYQLNPVSGDTISLKDYFQHLDIGQYSAYMMTAGMGRLALFSYDPNVLVFDRQRLHKFSLAGWNTINFFYFDSNDNLWVGSSEKGLCRIDLKTDEMEFYAQNATGNHRLLHNLIHCMTEDHQGRLWIGTESGLCLWSPEQKIFSWQQQNLTNPDGLSSNPIYSALCDHTGNVWLGTYFSGINLWNVRKDFFRTLHGGVAPNQLGGNVVSCFTEDIDGNLWIGLEDMGLNRLNLKDGTIRKWPIGRDKEGLTYGNLHDLYFADPEHLWIGTYTGGINILNTRTGAMQYLNTQNTPGLMSNDIYDFLGVGKDIYISTMSGIGVYHKTTREITPFFTDVFNGVLIESMSKTTNRIWFSSRIGIYYYDLQTKAVMNFRRIPGLTGINFVKTDCKERLWIGDSFRGLFLYDPSTDSITEFNAGNGFPGTWIYSIQEGTDGWFWVATDKGLVKLKPDTGTSVLFNKDSGVPFSQFNYRASYRDSRGNMYFGSNQGLVYFHESRDEGLSDRASKVLFTGVKLFNQPVEPQKGSLLERSVNEVDHLELAYGQNVFTLEFSALNYGNQGKCHYAYYLEGFEKDYNYVGNQNFATYTNLGPGTYTFKVKASLNNSNWDGEVNTLKIIVKPPFWFSGWGYLCYFLVLVGIFVLIYMVGARIQKSRALVQIERREREHAVELNQIKLEFFTNISHELRTPLTLIIGPLSRLLADDKVSPFVKNKLMGINLNANRLLGLLNQLLEFRKIERGKEDLRVCETNICQLFANLEQSFAPTAEQSNLTLHFDCSRANETIWFDPPKVEKILINLISNAFKFTDAGGRIDVTARLEEAREPGMMGKRLIVKVKDTGRGMEPRTVNKIFDRFYQSESLEKTDKVYYGSGIGLAFVQSLVDVHRGAIKVKSQLGEGTVFKIELPASQASYTAEEITTIDLMPRLVQPVQLHGPAMADEEEVPEEDSQKAKILLVEDNPEVIEFIAGTLREHYTILKAGNGAEALEVLSEYLVDLILSDVMMPVMDGYEFTSKVKTNIETSHIPVILLTAKSGADNRFEGLKSGADYYIEKPFMAHILEQNIFNVLNTRKNLIRRFKRDAFMPVSELSHSESDKEFLDKLTHIIKSNIDRPDLDVSFLMQEMGVSRSMLHIKLKKITDCSTTEFINTVRLKEAVRLMAEKRCNVSEAAYKTGFSSPTYFTRRFKQYYGQSPRDFLQQQLN